jgi:hypothetical protein
MVWLRCHRTLRFLREAGLRRGWWADDKFSKPAEVLRDCRQCELELSASRPAQAQTTEPKDALEMGKQHLNTFTITARSFKCFGLRQRSGYVTRFLIDAAWNSAQRCLWTTLRLEEAAAAIACPGPVVQRLSIIKQLARRCENLAGRTGVDVLECEVLSTECPILTLRLVDHRDMRRYLRLIDQPVEVGSGTVGRIAGEPFGLDSECTQLRSRTAATSRTG